MVHSLDGDIDFFNIVTGVLQEVPYMFMICQDYSIQKRK